eukprot:364367-Chlamydomonas_euryale.AAC.10
MDGWTSGTSPNHDLQIPGRARWRKTGTRTMVIEATVDWHTSPCQSTVCAATKLPPCPRPPSGPPCLPPCLATWVPASHTNAARTSTFRRPLLSIPFPLTPPLCPAPPTLNDAPRTTVQYTWHTPSCPHAGSAFASTCVSCVKRSRDTPAADRTGGAPPPAPGLYAALLTIA